MVCEMRRLNHDTIAWIGRDTFSIIATGSGKSPCYQVSTKEGIFVILSSLGYFFPLPLTRFGPFASVQIPALITNTTTLVVSPLISLMEDQVNKLKQFGIS